MLWFDIVAVFAATEATLSGRVNALGWLVVGLFLFFAVARIYFWVSAQPHLA